MKKDRVLKREFPPKTKISNKDKQPLFSYLHHTKTYMYMYSNIQKSIRIKIMDTVYNIIN